jgi:hypothetical protein
MTASASSPTASTTARRFGTLEWAVAVSLFINVFGNLAFFLPGSDEIPGAAIVIALVLTVVAVVGAWGLWNRHRWGARITIAVAVLQILSSAPGLLDPPSAALATTIVVGSVLAIVDIVLTRASQTRAQLS